MHKLKPLVLAIAASPLLATAQSAQALSVDNIRLGMTPDRTRVVFDLSGPASYRLVENVESVTVIIEQADSGIDPETVTVRGTGISDISARQGDDGSLNYELDLTGDFQPRLFTLPPNEQRGHRLVLDLTGAPEVAPAQAPQTRVDDAADEDAIDSIAPAPTAAPITTTGSTARRSPVPRSAYFADDDDVDYEEDYLDDPYGDDAYGDDAYGDYEDARESPLAGYISMEPRLFPEDAMYDGQKDQHLSFAAELEYYRDWADGSQRFAFRPFGRYDVHDDERTHADIRELYWRMEKDNFLFKAGLDVVFWGVAESRHLVDIINQTDLVENIDGEDKLGQPMLNMDYMSDNWGTWQFYILPYFRERTFPGEEGRLRPDPAIDENDAEYEDGDEEEHIDYAVRWSHYIGDWDIGLAHFSGTSRDPLLQPRTSGSDLAIIPYYPQIDQTSVDAQATLGAWLLKLEAIYNDNNVDSYYAWTGGFEYTFYGVADSDADMGLLLEYNYDDRGTDSTSALQEDLYLGLRWSGNDTDSTELLAALVYDTDNNSIFGNIEASRRLGEHWTLGMELRFFTNVDEQDLLHFIEDDDYAEFQITRHF